MLAAMTHIGSDWYVDPNRHEEFRQLMAEHGHVEHKSALFHHDSNDLILVLHSYHPGLSSTDSAMAGLQEVLDRHGVPAIAAGHGSLWQLLFMAEEPVNQVDMMNSDNEAMRKLDLELLRRGIYVLPGVRRFVAAVNTDEDFAETFAALDDACRAIY